MQHYTHLTCVHLQLHAQNMHTARHYKKLRANYTNYTCLACVGLLQYTQAVLCLVGEGEHVN